MNKTDIIKSIEECFDLLKEIYHDEKLQEAIYIVSEVIISAIKNGNKVLFFGNGGSAADAQHMAGEFVCRFKMNRKSIPGIALTTDTSVITAISNDFEFKDVFARQIEGISSKGDIAFAISTSGNSENILCALKKANQLDLVTIGLTGKTGGAMKNFCNHIICIPSNNTPRIQEVHLLVEHCICSVVEKFICLESEK